MARKPATKSSRTASKSTGSRRKKAASAKPDYSNYDADQLREFYHEMLLIRRFEEKAGQMYGMGLIGGFCHLYIGQEAVVVGMQASSTSRIPSSPPTATMATCWPVGWTPMA